MTLQDLLGLGFQQTPEGKLFLPFSLTDYGKYPYFGDEQGVANAFWEADSGDPFYRRASFGNDQNAFVIPNSAEKGTYNNQLGYTINPDDLGYGPIQRGGSSWNAFRDDFVKPVALSLAGQGLFGGVGGDVGASGGSGSETLYGGAGSDTLSSGGSTDNYFGDYIGYEGDTGYFGDYGNGSFDGSGVDQFGNPTGEFADTGQLSGAGSGDFSSMESNPTYLDLAKKYGTTVAKYIMGKLGGGSEDKNRNRTLGQSILGQFGSDPMGSLFSATPFLLALAEANRQRGDINQTIDRLRELEGSVAGNASPYMNAILNPYDKETVTGRAALLQDQGLRGVRGSSFGDQGLSSYDYARDLGRGDIASKALLGSTALQGNLIGSELDAITKRNTNRNLLLGAGLSASGRLFQPEKDPFNLSTLLGL